MTRIVFFGSPTDAVPSLRAIVDSGHDVAAVYTRPDRPAGRRREPAPTPVKTAAQELGLSVATPESLRDEKELDALTELEADAFIVVAYGRILPPAALAISRLGALNVHPSLLPLYRGPSPVATAILDGRPETGVTVMLLDEGMDTGPILAQSGPVAIGDSDTLGGLTERLFRIGADLLVDTLSKYENGDVHPRPQNDALATVTKLLKRADGEIDWTQSAEQIERQVRAFDPWPGTFTSWSGRNLKVLQACRSDSQIGPGLAKASDGTLRVGTGDGSLELLRVQLEGRQATLAQDFLRGHPGIDGARLGSPERSGPGID